MRTHLWVESPTSVCIVRTSTGEILSKIEQPRDGLEKLWHVCFLGKQGNTLGYRKKVGTLKSILRLELRRLGMDEQDLSIPASALFQVF